MGLPSVFFLMGLFELVSGRSFGALAQEWEELKGWKCGIYGPIVVVIATCVILAEAGTVALAFLQLVLLNLAGRVNAIVRLMKGAVGALLALIAVASCGRPTRRSQEERASEVARTGGSRMDSQPKDARAIPDASVTALLDELDPPFPPPPAISRRHRRGDCKTTYAPRPDRDPNPMCRVDGGTFMYGGGSRLVREPAGTRQKNVEASKTDVSGFYIDQFEVTSAQAAVFLNAHGNTCNGLDKLQNPGEVNPCVWVESRFGGLEEKNGRFVAKKSRELWPEASFTWEGAMRYCAWAGKRVPSSAQWEYAARHDPQSQRDLAYPWGDQWLRHAAACNAPQCDPQPHAPLPKDGGPPDPAYLPVGTFDGTHGHADGSSPWGLHDTSGGAAELVFECSDPEQTCEAGAECDCRILTTSSLGAQDLSRLRTYQRVDETAVGFGLTGVRCARVAH